ncbi:leucine-rich repeat domain-containing protein [Abyssalbus ytuae]|uniref:Leucine-rich repeat domain-containing protein n=1 Tax=Abyssalbus ytuae TaxID=2926907 RepID=A0A9E6ZQN0_9FLAO|nr:leucine-rich repeat domain-containing protein [Abyssalbus ytuae]UOB19144.1 leucine-rich repeat domain-containing protein [Abyssalbus ytuae]
MKKYFYVLLFVAGGICMASCNKDDDNPSPKSDAKQILSFVFKEEDNTALNEDVTAAINQEDKTITATVPFGTELTSLLPLIEVSEKAAVSLTGAQDFSSEVDYVVTAENGTKATYKVSVKKADPGTGKQILSFVFKATDNEVLSKDMPAEIDQDSHTIIAGIPASIDVTTLTPSIEASEGAVVLSSGPQECSNEVIYTVTAQDATQATYTFTFKFTATTQKEVLMAIYKSNPCNYLSWDLDNGDIGTWTGVYVDDEGNITELSLGEGEKNSSLSNVPESDRGTSLKTISLNKEGGYGLTNIPAAIGQLTSLVSLSLGNNQLASLPAEIGQLTNLKFLYLYENQLTSIPAEIGQLASLEELYLYENQLTSIPAEIGQLINLTYLDIRNNPLTSIPSEVCNLENNGTNIIKDDGVTCETAADD